MKKRIADALEKLAVASFAVGMFQGNDMGYLAAVVAFGLCLYITRRLEI